MMANRKLKVATTSLGGCFGCHMSFLDIDERLVQLVDIVQFNRSPLTDIKHCSENLDVGLVEGGLCNSENVHVLKEFRERCRFIVAVGACAINGGIPALRNGIPLVECLTESYLDGFGLLNAEIPSDPELPLLLDRVRPVHELVKIDYFLPGCPPSADNFWRLLTDIAEGREPALPYSPVHYD